MMYVGGDDPLVREDQLVPSSLECGEDRLAVNEELVNWLKYVIRRDWTQFEHSALAEINNLLTPS